MAKHREKDVNRDCKNHGANYSQNISGGIKRCLNCGKPCK